MPSPGQPSSSDPVNLKSADHEAGEADSADLRRRHAQLGERTGRVEQRIEHIACTVDALSARTSSIERDFRELLSVLDAYLNEAAAHQAATRPRSAESRSLWKPALMATAALLVCLSAAGAFLLMSQRPLPVDSARQTPAANRAAAPVAAAEPPSAGFVTPPPADIRSPEISRVPPAPGRVDLLLEATKPTWVSVTTASGVKLIDRLLEPGAPVSVKLDGPARLRAGNAGALVATVDGRPIGPIGPPGGVRNVEIYADGSFRLATP